MRDFKDEMRDFKDEMQAFKNEMRTVLRFSTNFRVSKQPLPWLEFSTA